MISCPSKAKFVLISNQIQEWLKLRNIITNGIKLTPTPCIIQSKLKVTLNTKFDFKVGAIISKLQIGSISSQFYLLGGSEVKNPFYLHFFWNLTHLPTSNLLNFEMEGGSKPHVLPPLTTTTCYMFFVFESKFLAQGSLSIIFWYKFPRSVIMWSLFQLKISGADFIIHEFFITNISNEVKKCLSYALNIFVIFLIHLIVIRPNLPRKPTIGELKFGNLVERINNKL